MDIIDYCRISSPLGPMLLAARSGQLVGVWFDTQKYYPQVQADLGWRQADTPILQEAARQLDAYFHQGFHRGQTPVGGQTPFDLPLAPKGTDFQRAIWALLETIPVGQTQTYGEVAQRYGDPKAVRAVGAAVGRNPISIIVPCHRVVGANGSLTGYAGGVDRKAWLLEMESGQQPMAFAR